MNLEAMIGAAAAVGVAHFIASRRRGDVRKHFIGSSQIVVRTAAEPRAAFDAITHIGSPYRVDDSDAASLRIVLSKSPSIWSGGWFFPIDVAADDSGTKITIGIMSRLWFGGIVQTGIAHERCAKAIRALFTMPEMRVT